MNTINTFTYKNPYFFVTEAKKLLIQNGYVEFREDEEWTDLSINKFFVVRNDSSIIAVNKHDTSSALIVSTHNDSPCFKLKPNTKLSRFGYDQVRVAPYGNMAYSTWIDRDLTYIGKILTKPIPPSDSPEPTIEKHFTAAASAVAIIPSLAKHLGGLQVTLNTELSLMPIDNLKVPTSNSQSGQLIRDLLSLSEVNDRFKKYQEELKQSEDEHDEKNEEHQKENKLNAKDFLIDWDISLIPSEPTREIGTGSEMIAGYAVDVLASAISSIDLFVKSKDPDQGMKVLAIFDNYQLNGNTRIGSKSNLLRSVLERIGCDNVTWSNSYLLTIDNFNAYNPNEPPKVPYADTINAGDGLFIHSEMGRSGSANLNFKSQLMFLAKKMRIPLTPTNLNQYFSSSIAQDIETQVNIQSAIVGIPIIGLKTARELAFKDDIACIKKLVSSFYDQFASIPAIKDI